MRPPGWGRGVSLRLGVPAPGMGAAESLREVMTGLKPILRIKG